MESDGDIVTTIRVVGVPSNTTEQEFNCWFLFADGFEQGKLVQNKGAGVSQLGWARFSTVEAAEAAILVLNGRTLNEYQTSEQITLTADMAKSNFKPTPPAPNANRRPFQQSAPQAIYSPPPQPVYYQPPPVIHRPAPVYQSHSAGSISTMIVGGLSAASTEEELYEFGYRFHGFEKLKFMAANGSKAGMCFLKFQIPEYAQAAFEVLSEGHEALPSNPSVPVRPEWAKNDLDAPRDAKPAATWATPQFAPQPVVHYPVIRTMPAPAPVQGTINRASANPPGDTLFIGSMAAGTGEDELTSVLMGYSGFVKVKMCGGNPNSPIALALFDSVQSCTQALQQLSGLALPSAPHQAINCEYAKNSLGKRTRY